MNAPEILARLLFPPKCVLCRRLLDARETDLCRSCRAEIDSYPPPKNRIPMVAKWTAVWYYEGSVRESLLRFKFHDARSYADAYGRALSMKLLRELPQPEVLTWVPISGRRKWRRGYDQVQLIAQAVGRELGMEPVRTLEKRRHNPPQSGIREAARRRANVLGAYAPVEPGRFLGKRVLLLDDIITTGATLSECARVLRTAGAGEVICAAVAAARNQ